MGYSDAQKRATNKFRSAQKRIDVQIPIDAIPAVEQYAAAKGLTIGALLKDCLTRCMQLDGLDAIPTTTKAAKQARQASTQAD